MKRILNISIMPVLLAALLFFAMPALAEGGGPGCEGGEKGGKMMEKMTEDLGLTQEQQDQIKALREEGKGKAEALRTKSKEVKQAMRDELNKTETDSAKVRTYVDELTGLYRQKLEQRVDGVLGMKKVLTPEQFTKLNEKMKEKRAAWKERRGHRKMGRGPEGPEGEGEEKPEE